MEKEWYFSVKYSKNVSWIDSPIGPRPPHPWAFGIILRHYIRCKSSRRVIGPSQRQVPNNAYNTHKKFTSLLPAGFQPQIETSHRPQTHSLYRVLTGIGNPQFTTAYSRNVTKCFYEIRGLFHSYNICRHCRTASNYVMWEKVGGRFAKLFKIVNYLVPFSIKELIIRFHYSHTSFCHLNIIYSGWMCEPVIVDRTLVSNSFRNSFVNGLKHYVSFRSLFVYEWCGWFVVLFCTFMYRCRVFFFSL